MPWFSLHRRGGFQTTISLRRNFWYLWRITHSILHNSYSIYVPLKGNIHSEWRQKSSSSKTDEGCAWHFLKESPSQGSKDLWDSYVQMALKWAMGHLVQRMKLNLVQSKTHKPHIVEMSGASAVNSAWLCFTYLPKRHQIIRYCRHRWCWHAAV